VTLVHALLAILQEAVDDFRRSPAINGISVFTMAVSLALVGAFLVVASNMGTVIDRWTGDVRVDVFLRDGAEEAIDSLEKDLALHPLVTGVRRVSPEEALAEFREMFPDLAAVPDELRANPFQSSLRATVVQPPPSLDSLAALAEAFASRPGVEEVSYDQSWIDRLASLVRLFSLGGVVVGSILILAALFTMSSVIRLNVYARQEEIALQRLVGATSNFIRGPFVAQGMLQGAAGAAIALVALYLGQAALARSAGSEGNALLLLAVGRPLPLVQAVLLVLLGGTIGLVGSAAAVRRFLRL
jgi:cell division transport system permease protein